MLHNIVMIAGAQAATMPLVGIPTPVPAAIFAGANHHNPIRRAIFFYSLIYIFIRFSMVHEAASYFLGINLYLAYIFGLPSILGVLLTGGFLRLVQNRLVQAWIVFALLLVPATVFSTWRGGSLELMITFLKSEWSMLFVVACLAVTWREVKMLHTVMMLSGFGSLVIAKLLMKNASYSDRFELSIPGSSISNSNDLAGHLILLMPFYLYTALTPKRNVVLRGLCLAASAYSVYIILGSGSRGAMVGVIVLALALFLVSGMVGKLSLAIVLPLVAIVTLAILPGSVQRRLTTFDTKVEAGDQVSSDAGGSLQLRKHLFEASVAYTLTHPLFGVGPGMFAVYDDKEYRGIGMARGTWHNTHNIYTQISSECGIPAFLCFVFTLFGSFLSVRRLYSRTKYRADLIDIHQHATTLLLSLAGFLVTAGFLTIGYRFQLPAMAGLAIVTATVGQQEIARRLAQSPPPKRPALADPTPPPAPRFRMTRGRG